MTENVTVTDGDNTVELPERLAKLLLADEERGWKRGRAKRTRAQEPTEEGVAKRNTPDEVAEAVESDKDDDAPVPMSYIPGVVEGVTMGKIKQLVNDGLVPFTLRRNAKLVRPSDVRAAIKARP